MFKWQITETPTIVWVVVLRSVFIAVVEHSSPIIRKIQRQFVLVRIAFLGGV